MFWLDTCARDKPISYPLQCAPGGRKCELQAVIWLELVAEWCEGQYSEGTLSRPKRGGFSLSWALSMESMFRNKAQIEGCGWALLIVPFHFLRFSWSSWKNPHPLIQSPVCRESTLRGFLPLDGWCFVEVFLSKTSSHFYFLF